MESYAENSAALVDEVQKDDRVLEDHVDWFRTLNRRQQFVTIIDLLRSENVRIIYNMYWLCRRMVQIKRSFDHDAVQRSSQEVGTTGYQKIRYNESPNVLIERDISSEGKTTVKKLLPTLSPEEVIEDENGIASTKEEIENNLKHLLESWNGKIKLLQQELEANEKAKMPAGKPGRNNRKRVQKTNQKNNKTAEHETLDWGQFGPARGTLSITRHSRKEQLCIWELETSNKETQFMNELTHYLTGTKIQNTIRKVQLLPLWINRYMTSMAEDETRKTMQQVNSYWDRMVVSTKAEAAVREVLNASIVIHKEKISGSREVEDETSCAVAEIMEPLGGEALDELCHTTHASIFSGECIISSFIYEFLHSRVIACSPSSQLMAASTTHNSVALYSLLSGSILSPVLSGHAGTITCMCFHPDSCHIVTGSTDTTVRCWHIWSRAQLRTYEGHTKKVTCLSVSQEHVASGDEDNRIRGMCVFDLRENHAVTAVQLLCNSRLELFSGCRGGEITHYDVLGSAIITRVCGHSRPITSLSVQTPILASGSLDGWIRLWDCRNLGLACLAAIYHGGSVSALHLSDWHIVSGSHCGQVKVWRAATGSELRTLHVEGRPVFQVYSVFRKDRTQVVVGTDLGVTEFNFVSATNRAVTRSTVQLPMFGTLSFVEGLSDLAPPPPLLEDFVYHWRKITNFYIKHEPVTKVVIENTNIPAHLDQLMKILVEEETVVEMGTAGPCLEYLLQHKIPDLLVTLAGTDSPPGMKSVTLCFMCKLLTQLRDPTLPHIGISTAVQKLVSMCNGMHASPTELDEIHFLCTLCAVVGRYPHLINIFNSRHSIPVHTLWWLPKSVECFTMVFLCHLRLCLSCWQYTDSRRTSISSNSSSLSSGCEEPRPSRLMPVDGSAGPVCRGHETEKLGAESATITPPLSESHSPLWGDSEQFVLVDALLSFLHSADNRVTVKACEGLMLVAALPSDSFAQSLARGSNFCAELAARLATLYRSIPHGVDANDLDDMHVNWGLDSPLWSDGTKFNGCREVAAFLAWLDYCDQLVRECHPTTGRALAQNVHKLFLEEVLEVALSTSEEADLVFATAFVAKCLRQITAEALLTEWMCWLVGESLDPELPDVHTCPLRKQLFDNCFHDQDEISLETLRLFEVMLEKPSQHALHCLVLTYLNSRGYYDMSSSDSAIGSWSDEEEERERNNRSSPTLDFSEGSSPISRTLAPRNIDKLINSFLQLLPRQLHSTSDPEDEGYEQYVLDADRQYRAVVARCANHAWPSEAVFPEDCHSSDSRPEADHEGAHFYEGPFLRMLFTRLVRLPYQPYEINLQLTSLVSRLAMLPHPYLHEYLLNPLLPIPADTNTLHRALELVAAELADQVPRTKGFKAALCATRRRLLDGVYDPRDESNSVLESVVVLEEFTKELAAIAFVKYHHSS